MLKKVGHSRLYTWVSHQKWIDLLVKLGKKSQACSEAKILLKNKKIGSLIYSEEEEKQVKEIIAQLEDLVS